MIASVLRHRAGAAGAVVVVLLVLAGVAGPLLVGGSPGAIDMDNSLAPPGFSHPLGTDVFGRDVLCRLLYGARFSLEVSVFSRLVALALGTILGLVAGYFGGRIDQGVMRLADVTMAYPGLLLLIAVVAAVGPSKTALFVSLGVVGWAGVARLVRAQVLSIKTREYVTAARSLGMPHGRIIARHVLPNCLSQLIVIFSMGLGAAIMAESSVSFLGLGAQPPTPSWGVMISDGLDYLRTAPWLCLSPGVVITATVFGFNMLGDAIRDVLDPKMMSGRRFR